MTRWLQCAVIALLAFALIGCESTPRKKGGARDLSRAATAAELNADLGLNYMKKGQLQTAREKLDKAMELDARSPTVNLAMALFQDRIGDRGEAYRFYKRAVQLDGNNGESRNNFGAFLCREERFDESEEQFLAALNNPYYQTPALAYENLGTCMRRAGQSEKAEEYLRQALEINPKSALALYQLSTLFLEAKDPMRARAFFQRLEAVENPGPEMYLLGYNIESNLGNTQGAQEYRRQLIKKFPNSQEVKDLPDAPSNSQ
jgi:type IV pilus assembly protein PilF